MQRITTLHVFAHSTHVGVLTKIPTQDGGVIFSFQYNENADITNPISLIMPVRDEPYLSRELHPVFESSMPEGHLMSAIIRRFGRAIYPDEMGVLSLTGHNRVGHLQLSTSEIAPNPKVRNIELPAQLSSNAMTEYVNKILADYGEQSGIAGTMPKVIAHQVNERITAKNDACILKFDADNLPYLSANEFFCLMAARKIGMKVPDATLMLDGRALAVERFDIKEPGSAYRYGFEDACSLLGLSSKSKYNGSNELLATRLFLITHRSDDQVALFKAMIFSHITRNGDAHLKNYGVLYDGYDNIALAPIYDLVTTTAYEAFVNDTAALSMRGNHKYEWGTKNDFLSMSELRCYNTSKSEALALFENIGCALSETSDQMLEFAMTHDETAQQVMLNMMIEWQKGLMSVDIQSKQLSDNIELLSNPISQRDSISPL